MKTIKEIEQRIKKHQLFLESIKNNDGRYIEREITRCLLVELDWVMESERDEKTSTG